VAGHGDGDDVEKDDGHDGKEGFAADEHDPGDWRSARELSVMGEKCPVCGGRIALTRVVHLADAVAMTIDPIADEDGNDAYVHWRSVSSDDSADSPASLLLLSPTSHVAKPISVRVCAPISSNSDR